MYIVLFLYNGNRRGYMVRRRRKRIFKKNKKKKIEFHIDLGFLLGIAIWIFKIGVVCLIHMDLQNRRCLSDGVCLGVVFRTAGQYGGRLYEAGAEQRRRCPGEQDPI